MLMNLQYNLRSNDHLQYMSKQTRENLASSSDLGLCVE